MNSAFEKVFLFSSHRVSSCISRGVACDDCVALAARRDCVADAVFLLQFLRLSQIFITVAIFLFNDLCGSADFR